MLTDEEWKAFQEYDNRAPTQEEIDELEESYHTYCRHQNRMIDESIIRFHKL